VSSIYRDGTYLAKNPTWHAEDSGWKANKILAMIRKHDLTPRAVGEIGCGSGEVLVHLREWLDPWVVFHGYDIANDAYDMARPKERDNLVFHCTDVLQDPTVRFDLLLVVDVLEHIEDYIGFLHKIKKKGDYKLFHIPLELSVQTVLRAAPIRHSREQFGHLHYFTEETAIATIESAGMTVLDREYTFTSVELAAQRWRRSLARGPRRLGFAINPRLAVRILGGASLLVLAR
jgi:SAM-dependent methyltransferase